MARPSKYPEEFRKQAAVLVPNSGRSVRDIARELDVNHDTLRSWVDRARKERADQEDLNADERAKARATATPRRRARGREVDPEKAAVFFARETER
jgi:transposase